MLKIFKDDVGDIFMIDISKIQALSIDPCQYVGSNGELKNGTQVAVASMWLQVKTEIVEFAESIGIQYS